MKPSIGALCIHGFKPPLIKKSFYKNCSKLDCKTCPMANPFKYFITFENDYKFPILSNRSCDSKNLIYIIKCKFCHCYYVGQTSDLKKRMSAHKIANFIPFSSQNDVI